MTTKNNNKQKALTARRRIVALAVTAVVLFIMYCLLCIVKYNAAQVPQPYNQVVQQINELHSQQIPEDAHQRALYFAQLGQNYESAHDFTSARDYYLQAQHTAEASQLENQVVYYETIARTSQEIGDIASVKVYLEKQRAHLQAFLTMHPDDETTKKAIKNIDERMQHF